MGLPRCDKITRTTLISIVITAMVLVGGCTRMVSGRPVQAGPKLGQPLQWGACHFRGGSAVKVPPGAQCGKIAVPVDYRRRDGGTATLAMIRFPATGAKIGSLIVNPVGPANRASRPPSGWCRRCRRGSASGST
ncbi:putative hydrolase [Mycobacterium xenopi 4042]|uniref:Putative hydrolase n=1 Tax=Mycobacterium xenopi 4042 TaxID=1299334 RepID=X8DB17_MYCXE|nr:putative hydrolase [Mycobacterium xenopi 4042]